MSFRDRMKKKKGSLAKRHNTATKPSGGRYHSWRKRRLSERGHHHLATKLSDETEVKIRKGRSGLKKVHLSRANFANVKTDKATKKVKIKAVKENAANRHFTRQNIITKGTIIDTELGLAKVTSRPTKHGIVNAVLVKK